MLKNLRERTKTILWIVVLAFVISIFALWGMDLRTPDRGRENADVVGSVDGEDISYQAYQNALNQLWAQMKEQRGEEYEPSEIERSVLADQAWELAVRNRLMAKKISDLNIAVSDEELVSFLRKNPHPQLLQAFTGENGQFDYQAYLRALADPEIDWSELERWGRAVIPEIQFQTYLLSQVHVPEREVLERFKERNTTTRATYVEITVPSAETQEEPAEAELRARYEEKKKDFTQPAMRRIRLIEIDKAPTAADEEDAAARLADIRSDIIEGRMDFATAAADYSDDEATASKGGDLGFIKKGDMVPEFEQVAFSLPTGRISEPFKSQYGYHIVTVTGRRTEKGAEEIHASHILVKIEPGTDTIDSLSTFIRDLTAAIRDDGFEAAAAAMKLATRETEPFPQGMFVKDVGFVPRIVSFAFNHRTGNVSYGIESESKVYFVKILEEIPERVRAFEEVRPQLAAELRSSRADEAAKTRAAAVRRSMIANGFGPGAAEHGLAVQSTPPFAAADQIPGIGANTAFSAACRYLAIGGVSPPIKVQNRYFIISVVERTEPDAAAYGEARTALLGEMQNEEASRFMANWYQSIRDEAKIEDLREKPLR